MRFYLFFFLACLPFGVLAGPATQVTKDPAALKAQLQDYYFDAARRGDVPMLETFIEAGYSLDTPWILAITRATPL